MNSKQKLSDIMQINPKRQLKKDVIAPFVAMNNITANGKKILKFSKKKVSSSKTTFQNGDTLLAKITPSLENGKTAFVDILKENEIGHGSTEFFVLCGKKNQTLDHFVYYLMRTNEFREEAIRSMTGTSGRQRVQETVFDDHAITLPSLPVQETICRILTGFDEKINNLQKQNNILEQLSQAIFKSWFIDFKGVTTWDNSELGKIPKEWRVDILKNHLDLTKGVSYKSSELIPSNKALVTLKSIKRGGGYVERGLKSFDGKYKDVQILYENDMIVAQTDLTQDASVIGKPALVRISKDFDTLIASLDLVIVKLKNNENLKFYLYHLFLTEQFKNHISGYVNGTGVLHLANDGIPSYRFLIPEKKILEKFNQLVSCMMQKNRDNYYQIQNLTKTRDALLPKLMSGEIRV